MPNVASGVICVWDGTAASIPANFTRVTTLDGRYGRGAAAGVNPGGTGGSATHTHTDPGHTHNSGGHVHGLGTLGGAPPAAQALGSTRTVPPPGHTHTGGSSLSAVFTLTGGAVWSTAANDPTNYTVIWVQSTGTPTGFAANMSVWWSQTTLPLGWTPLTTAAGAFPKGAAPSANGGTLTTVTTHTHTDATHSHTAAHTHGSSQSSAASTTIVIADGGSGSSAGVGHTHELTIASTSVTSSAASTSTTGATAYEPPSNMLTLIKNTSGAASFPAYAICLWLGTLASIPTGWQLCDGTNGTPDMRGFFAKCSTNLSDIGTTKGSLDHAHTAPAAGHTHDISHSHTYSTGAASNSTAFASGTAGGDVDGGSHAHTNPGSDTTALLTDAQISQLASVLDARPPYTDVAFIMYTAAPVVTITTPAPSAVESLPTFAVTWSYAVTRIQVTYRLFVYDSTGTAVIYDSLPQRSSALTATIPAGYLQDNTTYKVGVVISDSGNQSAASGLVQFSTNWSAPPTPGSVTATPIGGS